MKLRVGMLLKKKGMTAYALSKASGEEISLSQAYRLANDEWDQLPRTMITALCDALGVEPAELFEYTPKREKA